MQYDNSVIGAGGYIGASTLTTALIAAAGADVFFAYASATTDAPTLVQYNGNTLTLARLPAYNTGTYGKIWVYRGVGMGTGTIPEFHFHYRRG